MTNENIQYLVDILERASHEYYNNGTFLQLDDETVEKLFEIVPTIPQSMITLRVMTDAFFDVLEDGLRTIDPKNQFLKKVGSKVTKLKAKLPIQMSGLEKITAGTVFTFTDKNSGPYICSDKLDGISIQIQYGDEIKAFTRGDGIYGEDISYLVPYLKLPKSSPYKNIRGEIIMKRKVFEQKWSKEYENARNLVAGKVNAISIHAAIYDMDVVIYGVLSDHKEAPSVQLAKLEKAGFNVVTYVVLPEVNDKVLSDLLRHRKAESPYELDGIVVVTDRSGLKHTVDSPSWGRKYKENVDFYEVAVTGVNYEASKDGYLKPTLTIEPTRMSGVTVSNTTAFNQKFIVDNRLGVGARIIVTRSGDVIPHIVEVIEGAEQVFEPNEAWVWNETGVDAVVADPDSHRGVLVRRVGFFFRALKIDELAESSFEKVIAAGFDSVDKIIKMTQADWKSVEGFAGKRGEIAYKEMRKCLSNVYLPNLADATGFFGRGFGTTRFEAILAAIPDVMQRKHTYEEWYRLTRNISGFGDVMAEQFATGITKFQVWVEAMGSYITFQEPEKVEVEGQVFAGQNVTFTGFRNAEWQTIIEKQGGQYIDFGSKTTMLVYGGKKSTKVDKAIAKGIRTFSQGEFLEFLEQNKLA